MIFKQFRHLSAVLALAAATAFAAPSKPGKDDTILGAYDAYRAGDALKLARVAKSLEGHGLAPWLEYWRVSMRLEDATAAEVDSFFAAYGDMYVGERLRGEWLRVLGRRADWERFEREAARYARDELEVRCYGWLARLARGDNGPLAEVGAMWLEPRGLPTGCETLVAELLKRDRFSVTDIWQRVRVLFENGQIAAAKEALGYLSNEESPDERLLADAARQPRRVIENPPKNLERRAAREVVVLAGIRYARSDTAAMAEALEGKLGAQLPEKEAKYLWGRVAYEAASRALSERALAWYERAGDTQLDDEQLAWKARMALRRGNWAMVRDAIDRMSIEARRDPAWTYWYGRALAAQGEDLGARAYFLRIAGQTDFYGLLANEELGYVAAPPETAYVPNEEAVARARGEAGLARALELIRLGLRSEGVREWLFTLRPFSDEQLLAASELARRAEVYDRAIHAADRTARTHNFALRYPVPFRDVFREYASTHGLDEAWVLGLVRQESRFIAQARSSAGAQGLMQLMPRTAQYVARKIGLRGCCRKDEVTDVKTNVSLGTGYLKMVLDQLGHPVLASAAYNAGPGRARRWRDARPLEGAIYAESIPFNETRDYVKKVMANAVFYAALLQKKTTPLKTRLGTIPAKATGETVDEELP
jgi:soluble lytic murein transglycosylase